MISHVETSTYMNLIVNLSKANLFKDGYAYPLMAALIKGRNPTEEIIHESIMDHHVYRMLNFKSIEEENEILYNTEDIVYIHVFLIRIRTVSDEEMIEKLSKTVAKKLNPDAIGYTSCCLYNEYTNADKVSHKDMLMDPEASRILHSTYYIKGEDTRRDCISPYINRGILNKDKSLLPDFGYKGRSTLEVNYDVLIAESGWYTPTEKNIKRINNPFK